MTFELEKVLGYGLNIFAACLISILVVHGGETSAYIIVHCHNPEGAEIGLISGVEPQAVAIYDGTSLIGYGAHNAQTHGQPIPITPGDHTIKATFNGIVVETRITLQSGGQQSIVLTFPRTEFDLAGFLAARSCEHDASVASHASCRGYRGWLWGPQSCSGLPYVRSAMHMNGYLANVNTESDYSGRNLLHFDGTTMRILTSMELTYRSKCADFASQDGDSWVNSYVGESWSNANIPAHVDFANWFLQERSRDSAYPPLFFHAPNSPYYCYPDVFDNPLMPSSKAKANPWLPANINYTRVGPFLTEWSGFANVSADATYALASKERQGSIVDLKMSSVPYDLTDSNQPNAEITFLDADELQRQVERQVAGAAADGASRVAIRITGLKGGLCPDKVQVVIGDGDGSNDGKPAVFGSECRQVYLAPVNYVRPNHPEDFVNGQRPVDLKVLADGVEIPHSPLYLVKAPVVLLHGIWGKSLDWSTLNTELQQQYGYPAWSIRAFPYPNAAHFDTNRWVIHAAIKQVLENAQSANIVARKADVVAHSMGGLLAKKYGQAREIRSITVVGTPHYGSPLADLLWSLVDDPSNPLKSAFARFMKNRGHWANGGAIEDLRTNSGKGCAARSPLGVPNNVIVGISPLQGSTPNDFDHFLFLALKFLKIPVMAILDMNKSIFAGEDNDFVVGKLSQQGGVPGVVVPVLHHITEPRESEVLNTIIDYLHYGGMQDRSSKPTYSPQTHPAQARELSKTLLPDSKITLSPAITLSTGNIRIVSPTEGALFHPGDEVQVQVEVSNSDAVVLVATSTGSSGLIDRAPYSFGFTIHNDAIGSVTIDAAAMDDVGFIGSHEVSVKIAVSATLTGMAILPEVSFSDSTVHSFVGIQLPLTVSGVFSDGVTRDITDAGTGTQYSSQNTAVLEISPDGVIIGKSPGTANVSVSNSGFAANVSFSILPGFPDLSLTMAHAGAFMVGGEGVYTLTVANVGLRATEGSISVVDTLPAGLKYSSCSGTGWQCSAAGQIVACTNSTPMVPGTSSTITLRVSVGSAALPSVTNIATANVADDGNALNDSVSDPTLIELSADFNSDGKPDILWRNTVTGEVVVWFMDGTKRLGTVSLGTMPDPNWKIVGIADFNSDGKPDLLWRNIATGANAVWYLDGTTRIGGADLESVTDLNWKIVGVADFNSDGKPDLLWRNSATGDISVCFMNGITRISGNYVSIVSDSNWKIVAVADFDSDGKPDILWRHSVTGANAVWFMDGLRFVRGADLEAVPDLNWRIVGVADLNGDGRLDILWRNSVTGDNAVWYMNGIIRTSGANLDPVSDTNWLLADFSGELLPRSKVLGPDFNGDGKPDILWLNASTGEILVWFMDGTKQVGSASIGTMPDPNWRIVGSGDINRDGKPDILWRNTATGQNSVWFMDGTTRTGAADLETVPELNWRVVGIADFNADGKADILWRNASTGDIAVWFMSGITRTGAAYVSTLQDLDWKIVAAADFNGDGKPDILWRNTSTGANYLWFMDGLSRIGEAAVESLTDTNWKVVAIADFNADGKPDILWRNSATGQNAVWYMNGALHSGDTMLDAVTDTNWLIADLVGELPPQPKIIGPDFNGDGRPDIVWHNAATGQMVVWFMDQTNYLRYATLGTVSDLNWKIVGFGDFNGDGKPDILWRNSSTGQNYVWFMNGSSLIGETYLASVPDTNWKIVGTADFNGDGKPDILWRNSTTGQNYLWFMNGTTRIGEASLDSVPDTNWKIVGTADFNADGKPDILWRNTANGSNYVWYMSGSARIGEDAMVAVGDLNWKLVGIADLNADRKPDLLWRNTATGENYVRMMNGITPSTGSYIDTVKDPNWQMMPHAY